MADRRSRLSRRWLYIPFAIAAIIVIAYYALWRYAADEMKKAVAVWVEDQRAAGLIVSHCDVAAEGFPFFLRVHIRAPDIAAPGEWRWRGETLTLDALPYDLNRLIFSPAGEQIVSLENEEWIVAADDLRASIANDKTHDWIFSMNIENAFATPSDGGASLSLGSLIFDLAPRAGELTTLVLTLAAKDIAAEDAASSFRLDEFSTVAALSQTQSLYGPYALQQWRSAGGALQITGLNIASHDARVSVAGSVSLDDDGYPTGQFNTEIVNPAGISKFLQDAGVLSQDEAEQATANLTLMALAAGGKISAPIDLKNGAAHIAGVMIADLPNVN